MAKMLFKEGRFSYYWLLTRHGIHGILCCVHVHVCVCVYACVCGCACVHIPHGVGSANV
jgi:hypothetical protein